MNTSTNQTSALAYTERLSHVLKQLDHAAIDRGVALIESTWKLLDSERNIKRLSIHIRVEQKNVDQNQHLNEESPRV